MPSRSELEEMREKLLASKGPNQELDADLMLRLGILTRRNLLADAPSQPEIWEYWDQERNAVGRHSAMVPEITASIDDVIRLIERDPAYRAAPLDFLAECSLHSPPRDDFDYARSVVPLIARHMLAGYLGALIAQTGETNA